jgi:uncharacterized Zn finger protein (UPF0148 family)
MAGDDGVFYCPTCRYTFMTKEEKRKIDALYEESNGGRIS